MLSSWSFHCRPHTQQIRGQVCLRPLSNSQAPFVGQYVLAYLHGTDVLQPIANWNNLYRAAIAEVRKGGDWTDHTFVLTEFECDVGEWQGHMLDAMEFYEQIVLDDECSMMSAEKAALMGIFDPDFDGRCISTRFMDAVNAARQRVNNVL